MDTAFAVGVATTRFTGAKVAVSTRHMSRAAKPSRSSISMKTYQVDVVLDGEDYKIPVDEDVTLLEAIEEYGLSVDSSCRAGVCMTCAAKVIKGEVDLGEAALADEAKEQGFVLTCSAYPRSDDLKIVMNQFDSAYDMQYGQFEEGQEQEEKSGGLFGGLFGKK